MPGISVVIRTFNSAVILPAVLARLPRSTLDELIVVDSGSQDGTLELVRTANARVVTLRPGEFSYGRSLNRGFEVASNEWVLALSSHCVPRPNDLLGIYRSALARFPSEVVAAVGPMLYSDLDWVLTTGITFFNAEDFAGGFGFGAGNPNCLYRRAVWRERPFDEETEAAEDLDWYVWAVRQGWHLAAVHAAAVFYRSHGGVSHFFRKGRIDYRATRRLIQSPQPKFSVVCTHSSKLILHALLRKIPAASFTASFWHYLGSYYESQRSERKRLSSGG